MKQSSIIVLPSRACPRFLSTAIAAVVAAVLLSTVLPVIAEPLEKQNQLLDESEYRSELEEVIIIGKQPEWRKDEREQQLWRPDRFEIKQNPTALRGRMQWFPEYSKEDRENYEGVRDQTDEKAEIKIFEWKF